MSGLIGKKIGMTSIYDANGKNLPCTVIEAGPCIVTQVKSKETEGYDSIQLAYEDKKEKHTTKALKGHFAKAGISPKKIVAEFTRFEADHNKQFGDIIKVDIFEEGEFIDVVGVSKGKGFQGVVKRHGFKGSPKTHGHKHDHRAPGSIGAQQPQHVIKGKRMAGRMGGKRSTVKNMKVAYIDAKKNMLAVLGGVPGVVGRIIEIRG